MIANNLTKWNILKIIRFNSNVDNALQIRWFKEGPLYHHSLKDQLVPVVPGLLRVLSVQMNLVDQAHQRVQLLRGLPWQRQVLKVRVDRGILGLQPRRGVLALRPVHAHQSDPTQGRNQCNSWTTLFLCLLIIDVWYTNVINYFRCHMIVNVTLNMI